MSGFRAAVDRDNCLPPTKSVSRIKSCLLVKIVTLPDLEPTDNIPNRAIVPSMVPPGELLLRLDKVFRIPFCSNHANRLDTARREEDPHKHAIGSERKVTNVTKQVRPPNFKKLKLLGLRCPRKGCSIIWVVFALFSHVVLFFARAA